MYKVGKAFLFIYFEIRGNCSNSGRQTVVNMIKNSVHLQADLEEEPEGYLEDRGQSEAVARIVGPVCNTFTYILRHLRQL